jgi:acetyl esterase/lipase
MLKLRGDLFDESQSTQMRPIDEVRQLLRELVGGPDTPFMIRRAQAERFAAAFQVPDDVAYKAEKYGNGAVEWVQAQDGSKSCVLLHFHGGGYVLGNPAGSRVFTTEFARSSGAAVASAEYRLAPEHPYPAAVEDALSAYRWLLESGVAPGAMAVAGESAGGGLALALLVAARDGGLPMPACAVLISPWLDLSCSAASFETKASVDPLLTRQSLGEMAEAYLQGADPRLPYASPLFANLAGLPPLLIQVGSDEVLLDDSLELERRACAQGVKVHLRVWPEMIHVWPMFHPSLPEATRAIAEAVAFTQDAWTPSGEANTALHT